MSSATFDGVRVLLLGNGARVRAARQLLVDQGAIVERFFGPKVTYVVVDRTVPRHDSQLAAARRSATPVLTTSELQKWPGMEAMASVWRGPVLAPRPVPATFPGPLPPAVAPIWRPVPSRVDPSLLGLGWGALALLSGGLATPALVGVSAAKLSSTKLTLATAAYAGLPIITFSLWWMGIGAGANGVALVALFAWLGTVGVGALHVYHLAQRVREHEDANVRPVFNSSDLNNARVLAALEHRRRLRAEARELVDKDPHTARQLGIGRPDKRGSYDDGGLIDVNNAPLGVLITLPGVTPEVADQIVTHRETIGAFASTSDLVVHTDLDPRRTTELEDITLFA